MLENQWVLFKHIPGYTHNYRLWFVKNDPNIGELTCKLIDPGNVQRSMVIIVDHLIHFFQETQIRFRARDLEKLESIQGKNFYDQGIFEVLNSSYSKELARQSQDIYKEKDFRHITLVTKESVIDAIFWCYKETSITIQNYD